MIARLLDPQRGTWVLLSFIAFFALIVAVNAVYITTALSTHSGVITKQPYEKGLAYDETLKAAASQPHIRQDARFENDILYWQLRDVHGVPLDAQVTARLIRPVQGGHDFDIALNKADDGVYKAVLDLPMKGRWDALLKAQWNNSGTTTQYQTRLSLTAR